MTSRSSFNTRLWCTALIAASLSGCLELTSSESTNFLRYAPCSAEGSIFADVPFSDWSSTYHSMVSSVVEEHISTAKDVNTMDLQCTADDYEGVVQPSSALKDMAQAVPAWKSDDVMEELSEADFGAVLLEFLRVYECSLNERYANATLTTLTDNNAPQTTGKLQKRRDDDKKKIDDEKMIARRTLDRTLELIGGYDRFRPLAVDVECLKRTSLDLRNVLGLASEASACLPRILDAHGSLRDQPEE